MTNEELKELADTTGLEFEAIKELVETYENKPAK